MRAWGREWRDVQRKTIGGSTAAAVAGLARFKTDRDAYFAMTAKEPQESIDSPDMMRGRYLEAVALRRFVEETGIRCKAHPQNRFVYNPAMPWAHALPDALTTHHREKEGVEAKVPRPSTFASWVADGFPKEYVIQAHHSIAVVGTPRWHLTAMNPVTMDVLHVVVERDEETIRVLMELEAAFFDRVQKRMGPPPLPRHDEPTTATVIPLKKAGGELYRVETNEAQHAVLLLEEAALVAKLADGARDAAEKRLRDMLTALGNVTAAAVPLPDGDTVRIYAEERAGRSYFDANAFFEDHTDLAPKRAKYTKKSKPSCPLRLVRRSADSGENPRRLTDGNE